MKIFTINKKIVIVITSLLLTAFNAHPAAAWMHASGNSSSWNASDSRGGSASGGDGSWDASGARGGTASGGDGSWSGTGYRGGTASGGDGSWSGTGYRGGTASGGGGSWSGTSAYGTSVYGDHGAYYGGTYSTYHPPTVVNSYSSGCYNCGGWAAAGAVATGAAIGAASAEANTANAYAEGVAAGSAYAMGAIYPTLPVGATMQTIGNATYYLYNGAWFSPSYGANGVYYRVVPVP